MSDAATWAPLVIAARALLGLVFLTAAAGKLRDKGAFHGVLHGYRLLPAALVGPVAVTLPVLEIVVGVLLPSGLMPGPTAASASAMLSVFAGAMAINILRGRREIDCGCFHGRPSQRLGWGAVSRTALLAATAVLTSLSVPTSLAAIAQGLVAAAILFVLIAAAATLPTLPRKHPRFSL